ncbi:MAG TPA: type II toxin-antitoxin system HicB family antitoxin [Mycobacteriales bacterium]|nr:type II toxin-antitoxin system HicB family antitoxin [Mycobacteriales bacterium]
MTTEPRTYRVVVTAEGDNWLADVPELAGAHTYARTLTTLDRHIREVIVLAADLPEGSAAGLRLELEFHTGDVLLDDSAARLRDLRTREAEIRRELAEETSALAYTLVRERSWSIRDAASLLAVSHQRVHQLLALLPA